MVQKITRRHGHRPRSNEEKISDMSHTHITLNVPWLIWYANHILYKLSRCIVYEYFFNLRVPLLFDM